MSQESGSFFVANFRKLAAAGATATALTGAFSGAQAAPIEIFGPAPGATSLEGLESWVKREGDFNHGFQFYFETPSALPAGEEISSLSLKGWGNGTFGVEIMPVSMVDSGTDDWTGAPYVVLTSTGSVVSLGDNFKIAADLPTEMTFPTSRVPVLPGQGYVVLVSPGLADSSSFVDTVDGSVNMERMGWPGAPGKLADVLRGVPAFTLTDSYIMPNIHIFADTPAVPEPEAYAMMLAGLGVLRAVARRRKLNA